MANSMTNEQKKFIEIHCTIPDWTDKRIAKEIGVHHMTVTRYRKKLGVNKDAGGNVESISEESKIKNSQKLKFAENDDQRRMYFKQSLIRSSRAKRITQMLDKVDTEYFVDRWVEYHLQFPDMTASEEDNLEKLILIDLRIIYNQKSMKECIKIQNELRESLSSKGKLDPENDKDLQIIHTINSQNGQEQALNVELTKLTKEYKDLQEAMNGTRQQRESSQRVGADTFFDLVRRFNQEEVRKEVGRYNELIRLSRDKKTKQLMEPHKYVDGTYDLPILDGAEIKKLKEEENKNGKQ